MGVLTQTFPGAPGGSNLALPQQELDDSEARLIQDGLVDYPGLTRRRGPVRAASGIVALTRQATGLVTSLNPQGSDRYAVLNGNATNGYFSVLAADLGSLVDLTWPHALPTDPDGSSTTRYRLVDAKPALQGGTLVGVSSAYDAASVSQGIALWRGGTKANYAASSVTVARGSTTLTAPSGFTANVVPGMFLFANTDELYTATYVGYVLSVNSDTSITLANPSPYAITAKAATFQSIRGLFPRITRGLITCDTNSTTVNGGGTKFVDQGLNSGTWQLYRSSDMTFIGKVSTVATNTSLTLTANAAIAAADTTYVALRVDGDWSIENTANVNKVGFLSAVYAERQWFANLGSQHDKTYRIWFTEPGDMEALDLSNDGYWIEVASTAMVNEPVKALIPVYNALLVLKENEAFGISGNSPESFSVRKVHDDGVLCGSSAQAFGGGAIWAGREGIHFYDGIQVTNLTQNKLGDVWKNSIRTYDPTRYRMWSMIARDHYFLFIERLDPTVAIVKGNTSSTPTRWTVCINMVTRAVTFLTNTDVRGAVQLPQQSGRAQTWYLVNDATKGVLCDASDLFDAEGADSFACTGSAIGPDFFFESKKFDSGDSLRLKRFKQLALHYLSQGAAIKVDTVLGLNNVGTTLTSDFPASVYTWDTLRASVSTWDSLKAQFATWSAIISGVFIPKRVKFLKRSQHFSFRLYQASAATQRLKIGPYQIGFKLMRPGRV